jgi:DNA excision repair protein ERCC-2
MLKFPFSTLRSGQETIINAVIKSAETHSKLMINAPTGIGKTAPVLFGALKALEGSDGKLVFLTAKHTHQKIVYETLKKMQDGGDWPRFAGINGKRSMCLFDNSVDAQNFNEFCRVVREDGQCSFFNNTFTPSRDLKSRSVLALQVPLSDPESVMDSARTYHVCPYEISLLHAKRSKVVVANYSHVFDPDISPNFLSKTGIDPRNSVLIIDEAHNLSAKLIDIFSRSISYRTLERAYRETSSSGFSALAHKIDKITSIMRSCSMEERVDIYNLFSDSDVEELDSLTDMIETSTSIPASYTLSKFVSTLLRSEKGSSITFVSKEKDIQKITISALDPSIYARETFDSFSSAVLMSGTLKPMEMFANILGIPDSERLSVESDFVDSNRSIITETDVTSKFTSRNLQSALIAERLDDITSEFKMNAIFFFPSYAFMDSVFSLMRNTGRIIKERQQMGREDKLGVLSVMHQQEKILFAVVGGNFSESIGIKDNKVKIIGIVGVPFEPPSVKLKALQEYYERKFGEGFEYAQVLPAMIKTMQAAGRGIRSEKDRAVVLLMDSRFASQTFRKYLPDRVDEINGSPTALMDELFAKNLS